MDFTGKGCEVPGGPMVGPCCNLDKGGCGCFLPAKIKALNASCPKDKWPAVMTDQEAYNFEKKLGE